MSMPGPNHTNAMNQQISARVTAILIDKLGLQESEITPDANFTKDLGIDSLDYAELVMEFEQAFKIKIPDSDAGQLRTIGEAIDYIESKMGFESPGK
jgi:acyl carrier protein